MCTASIFVSLECIKPHMYDRQYGKAHGSWKTFVLSYLEKLAATEVAMKSIANAETSLSLALSSPVE